MHPQIVFVSADFFYFFDFFYFSRFFLFFRNFFLFQQIFIFIFFLFFRFFLMIQQKNRNSRSKTLISADFFYKKKSAEISVFSENHTVNLGKKT